EPDRPVPGVHLPAGGTGEPSVKDQDAHAVTRARAAVLYHITTALLSAAMKRRRHSSLAREAGAGQEQSGSRFPGPFRPDRRGRPSAADLKFLSVRGNLM